MFRLIRILFVALVLAGIYFYLQHTAFITTTWQRTEVSAGLTLAFPQSARHHTRVVNHAVLGKTRLDVYDSLLHDEAYICLTIRPQHNKLQKMKLDTLIAAIRQLNDTDAMHISVKKQFVYAGYPAHEYHATDKQGKTMWVRLVKIENAVLSMIYVVNNPHVSQRQAENFFNTLKP